MVDPDKSKLARKSSPTKDGTHEINTGILALTEVPSERKLLYPTRPPPQKRLRSTAASSAVQADHNGGTLKNKTNCGYGVLAAGKILSGSG